MTLTVPTDVLTHATSETLVRKRERATNFRNHEIDLYDRDLTDEVLADLARAASAVGNKSVHRIASSTLTARSGDFSKTIPNFNAAPAILIEYLRHQVTDG